jgi:hypothetical protein
MEDDLNYLLTKDDFKFLQQEIQKQYQHQEKQSNPAPAGTELGTAQPQLFLFFLLHHV